MRRLTGAMAVLGAVTCSCTTVDGLWQPVGGAGGAAGAEIGQGGDAGASPDAGGGATTNGGAAGVGTGGSSTSGSGGTGTDPNPADTTVSVDVTSRFQALEGFGAAVAWYGDWLTGHPNKREIYTLLFRELGLDLLRLRNVYRDDPEAFDATSVEIMTAATELLGRRPGILLSSWSPPARLKANGDTECRGDSACTLISGPDGFAYAELGTYFADAVSAYAGIGLLPDYLSIQNEPDFLPPGWEGCRFDPNEGAYPSYARALQAVREALTASGLTPKLLGPEVIGLNSGRLAPYMQTIDASLLDVVAHHLYDGAAWQYPPGYVTNMEAARALAGAKPIFQTEFSVPGVGAAFEIAGLIHHSLTHENVAAYFHWELVWPGPEGLISLEAPAARTEWETERGYTVRDVYYSLQHYARFTDPGYVRVAADSTTSSVKASAFESPDARRLTVVLLNTDTSEHRVSLDVSGFVPGSAVSYRTSEGERFADRGDTPLGEALLLPPRSITTFVAAAP